MVDLFYTFTRTAETALGGATGALIFKLAWGEPLTIENMLVILGGFLAMSFLVSALYAWYEVREGEKFR